MKGGVCVDQVLMSYEGSQIAEIPSLVNIGTVWISDRPVAFNLQLHHVMHEKERE
jgi:hypothetical protein